MTLHQFRRHYSLTEILQRAEYHGPQYRQLLRETRWGRARWALKRRRREIVITALWLLASAVFVLSAMAGDSWRAEGRGPATAPRRGVDAEHGRVLPVLSFNGGALASGSPGVTRPSDPPSSTRYRPAVLIVAGLLLFTGSLKMLVYLIKADREPDEGRVTSWGKR